jgi:GcrA cell cycle regulator
MRGQFWTPEQDAELRRMADEGMSARQIAEVLGVSRNAAIGRAHRLKIPFKGSQATNKAPKARPVARRVKPIREIMDEPTRETDSVGDFERELSQSVPANLTGGDAIAGSLSRPAKFKPRRLPLLDLEWQDCRWIVAETGASALFCGLPKLEGCSYCDYHWRISVGRDVPFLPAFKEAAE